MNKVAQRRNVHEENRSECRAYWIYWSLNPVFRLLSASQIVLNSTPVELELFDNITCLE